MMTYSACEASEPSDTGVDLPRITQQVSTVLVTLLFVFFKIYFYFAPLDLHACVYSVWVQCPWRPEEGIRGSGSVVTGSWGLPCGLQTESGSSGRAVSALNHWTRRRALWILQVLGTSSVECWDLEEIALQQGRTPGSNCRIKKKW